jgi:serralysin
MNYRWLTPGTLNDEYSCVVLHEFGHALGCPHEHQHPEYDIDWNREMCMRI